MIQLSGITFCLDTSLKNTSLALLKDGQELGVFFQDQGGAQSEFLMQQIDDFFSQHQLAYADVSSLIFGEGPGAFTSLRVGCATLKGLFFGFEGPVYAVSSLRLRCLGLQQKTQNEKNGFVLSLGREQIAFGLLDSASKKFIEKIYTPEELLNEVSLHSDMTIGLSGSSFLEDLLKDRVDLVMQDTANPSCFVKLVDLLKMPTTISDLKPHYFIEPQIG